MALVFIANTQLEREGTIDAPDELLHATVLYIHLSWGQGYMHVHEDLNWHTCNNVMCVSVLQLSSGSSCREIFIDSHGDGVINTKRLTAFQCPRTLNNEWSVRNV